jgi:multidrug resistance efflux pump
MRGFSTKEMAASFHRITQSLQRDSGLTSTAASLVGVALFAAWGVWACQARVTRYESSDSARLEVNASAYPVQANLAGRLDASQLVLGRRVRGGEILAELDSSAERLSLDEERTRLAAIEPQIAAFRSQMQSEQAGVADERRVLTVSTAGAMAQYGEAEAQAALADAEAQRAESLRAQGILAFAEADRVASGAGASGTGTRP